MLQLGEVGPEVVKLRWDVDGAGAGSQAETIQYTKLSSPSCYPVLFWKLISYFLIVAREKTNIAKQVQNKFDLSRYFSLFQFFLVSFIFCVFFDF